MTNNFQVVHQEGTLPPRFNKKDFPCGDVSRKELYKDYVGPTSTVVVRKQILLDAGLFDETLPARQDYDMWLRVSKLVPLQYNYKPSVLVFRDGHASISSSYKRNVIGTEMVLKKIIQNNELTANEIRDIKSSQYRHMCRACILCDAYKDAIIYARKSLKHRFSITVFLWYVLCHFPIFFVLFRTIRKKYRYVKK